MDVRSPTSFPVNLNLFVEPFKNLNAIFLPDLEYFFSCCLGIFPLLPFILMKACKFEVSLQTQVSFWHNTIYLLFIYLGISASTFPIASGDSDSVGGLSLASAR